VEKKADKKEASEGKIDRKITDDGKLSELPVKKTTKKVVKK
jgi:hypothetical protein